LRVERGSRMGERIGIIMNGVTGRVGTNQHLIRSALARRWIDVPRLEG